MGVDFVSVQLMMNGVYNFIHISRLFMLSYVFRFSRFRKLSTVIYRFHFTLTQSPKRYSNSTSVTPPVTASTTVSDNTLTRETDSIVIPDPPTNCCMSGCANCVWITYAQELAAIYKDSGRVSERVMKAIDDPSLKIFLNLELEEVLKESQSQDVIHQEEKNE